MRPKQDGTERTLSRRHLLQRTATVAAAGLASSVTPGKSAPAEAASRRHIQRENDKPGTTDWQLTYTRIDPKTRYRCPWIEGYVSRASIRAGESLKLMVSTNPAAPFKVDFYRMGYYGGTGARHVLSLGPFDGAIQPDPPVGHERLRECGWEPCTEIQIPDDWASGVYLGKLSLICRKMICSLS